MRLTYNSAKAIITEVYYGNRKHPKNPFRNCKSPKEIFNLSRRISLEINGKLKRIGAVCTESGEVLLKGEQHKILDINKLSEFAGVAETEQVPANKQYSNKQSTEVSTEQAKADMEQYFKRDYFLPVTSMLAAVSLQNLQFEGIKLDSMGGLKLYCRKGVWPPTFDRIYSLYKSYLEERSHFLKEVNGILEVGTGSGVLSYILSKYVDKEQKIHALDINSDAMNTVTMNSNILNLQDKILPVEMDFTALADLSEKDCDKVLNKHK